MPKNSLSVVIITKNEEDKVARCLESVKWAGEIIMVDARSKDRTTEIGKRYGAKIIYSDFADDFGRERNIGIDNATSEWILQLDADEIVTPGLRTAIENVLKKGSEFHAFKFKRKNFFLGHFMKYGGWYHYSLHFFKRGFARYRGRVHHILDVKGKIGTMEEEIEHYPFSSLSQFVERQNRYTSIEAKEMLEQQKILPLRIIRYNLCRKPLKLFWKLYVKKRAFKDGMFGLVFSILFTWVHFLRWAKYWEQTIKVDEK